jgi:protein involved in polysaccharide export with SLBB domain
MKRAIFVAFLFTAMMVMGARPSLADASSVVDATSAVASAPSNPGERYVLGPTDKLRVTVFGEDALSGEYIIGSDGRLSLPLVGNVKAVGLTVGQLQEEITSAYQNGYVKDPKVTAEVISARPFFIMGEVKTPGQYPFVAGLTALNAVATAGGFTYRAKTDVVYIRHANEVGDDKVDLTPTTQVLPGDTIRIEERWF